MVHPDLNQSSPEVRAALIASCGEVFGRVYAASIGLVGEHAATNRATTAMQTFLDKLEHFGKD